MQKISLKLLFPLLLLPLMLALASPVTQDNTCPAIVQQALSELGPNCDALDRNSACYGYNQVSALFNEPQDETYFSSVSDQTPLTVVDTLETAPLNTEDNTWGVAVMKVQANVPNSLPGQAVTFVLLGDTEVRNEVSPADAFTPADPVDVTAVGSVNVRSAPSTRANVLGSVTDGTVLPADGRSEDGEWLRILFNDSPGWVNAALVIAPDAADGLPVLTDELRTPMQAFYLRTGVNSTSCNDAPDLLVVQGPDTMKVDLTVNGADIQIGSTIVLRSTQGTYSDLLNDPELVNEFGDLLTDQDTPGDQVCNITQIIVIDGGAEINDGSFTLPTGFTARSVSCGGADRSSGFMTPWGGSRPLTNEELELLKTLEGIPPELLNYPIELPTSEDIQRILLLLNSGNGGAGNNGSTSGPAAGRVDCSVFAPTSPLGSMPGKETTFYWDAAPGATSYTVRVYDSSGALVGEYPVSAPTTNVTGNPEGKENMSWDVSAYVDGQLACTTGRVGVLRDTVYESAPPPQQQYVTTCQTDFPPTCFSPCIQGASCGFKLSYCTCPVP